MDIVLGVKRRLSRRKDAKAAEADEQFQKIRFGIVQRDRATCQGCGFTSILDRDSGGTGRLEVHHINDDHHDQREKNLVTLCPFCHMAFTLGKRGAVFTAIPVWVPEVSQSDINRLAHLHFFLTWLTEKDNLSKVKTEKSWNDDDVALVKRLKEHIFNLFLEVQAAGEKRLTQVFSGVPQLFKMKDYGNGGKSRLATIYDVLATLPDDVYEQRDKILYGLRLVPEPKHFSAQIEFWARNVWLKSYDPQNWLDFGEKIGKALEEWRSSQQEKQSQDK